MKRRDWNLPSAISDGDLHGSARAYAAMGLRVIPVSPRSKKPPLISNWPRLATTDRPTIDKWWRRWPTANIGIATGVESGVLVIDVDQHKSDGFASLEKLSQQGLHIPDTLMSYTPNSGVHYFFRVQEKFKSGTGVLGPGIDVRAEGGYALVAPSIVEEGCYVWRQ